MKHRMQITQERSEIGLYFHDKVYEVYTTNDFCQKETLVCN